MGKITLGSYLRNAREKQKKSLELISQDVSVSKMYLSQIERDEKIPTDQVLKELAESYNLETFTLFELAGKVPPSVKKELSDNKHIQRLISRVNRENISNEQKEKMYSEIEQIFRKYLEEEEDY